MKRVQPKARGRCRSTLEHDVDLGLKSDKRKRRLKSYQYEEDVFEYFIEYKYNPDFKITNKDGHVWYLEVKGYLNKEERRKLRRIKECNPDLDLRVLFPTECPLPETGLTQTNVEWAQKHGFTFCVGAEIPMEWYK